MFFDRSGPTKDIWYYELQLPQGRKNYTKTKPLQFEELAECLRWFHPIDSRSENALAWRVTASEVLKYDENQNLVSLNLDIRNPKSAQALDHLPPEKLLSDILEKERLILRAIESIREGIGAYRN